MQDVIVAGAGPAGSMTAAHLARFCDVTVLERRRQPGVPVHCTGLITPRAFEMSRASPDILSKIRGANVHFPNGSIIEVRSKDPFAFLIDRQGLDSKLADLALANGARMELGIKCTSCSIGDLVEVETDAGMHRSKMIVGADGHSSMIARMIDNNIPKEYVMGMQSDVKHKGEEGIMNLRIGSAVAPGFFSWEIPFEDCTKVGLCVGGDHVPFEFHRHLLKVSGLDGCEVIRTYAGKIPLGGRRRTYGNRLALIGDAAGQVKPISGGGLYPIFKSAPLLSETIEGCIACDRFDTHMLSRYERAWKSNLKKTLNRGYMIRRLYTEFTDADLDGIQGVLSNKRNTSILNDIDLDDPSRSLMRVLMDPMTMLRLAPIGLKAII